MAWQSLWRLLRPWRCAEDTCGLVSREGFHAQLEREKYCADRYVYHFSLILFDMDEFDSNRQLAQLILGRIRRCDVAGWYDRQRIAVLAPYTSPAAAWQLAEDFQQRMSGKRPEFIVRAFGACEGPEKQASESDVEALEPELTASTNETADG